MLRQKDVCLKYDLSNVRCLFSGAAPLGEEVAKEFISIWPQATIQQAYGKSPVGVNEFNPKPLSDMFFQVSPRHRLLSAKRTPRMSYWALRAVCSPASKLVLYHPSRARNSPLTKHRVSWSCAAPMSSWAI